MPGQPKRRRLIKELERRARLELGEAATPLDYLCSYLTAGGRFAQLARDLAATMGESISRPLVSNAARWLEGEPGQREAAAGGMERPRIERNTKGAGAGKIRLTCRVSMIFPLLIVRGELA